VGTFFGADDGVDAIGRIAAVAQHRQVAGHRVGHPGDLLAGGHGGRIGTRAPEHRAVGRADDEDPAPLLRLTEVPVPVGGQLAAVIGFGNTTFFIPVTVVVSQAVSRRLEVLDIGVVSRPEHEDQLVGIGAQVAELGSDQVWPISCSPCRSRYCRQIRAALLHSSLGVVGSVTSRA